MPGVVGVEQVAPEGQEFAPVLGDPVVVDRVVLLEPAAGLRVLEGRRVRRQTDLAAAELAGGVHHLRQVGQRVDAPGVEQRLVGHQ
jgi:hypothetical protein